MATSPVERWPFSGETPPPPKYGVALTGRGKRARVGLVLMLAVIAAMAMAVVFAPQPAAASELAVSVNPQDLVVTEGETASYQVVLTRAPTPGELVIVAPVSSDEGAVTVSPTVLTFDDAYWWRSQTVTVTGVADSDKSNERVRITNQVTGSGLTTAPPVDVTVRDMTPTPRPAPAPAPVQEPPGKKDFKTCFGGRDCNNSDSPYYWKVNPNNWE